MKIVINKCFGGFSLSPLATAEIAKRKGRECFFFTQQPGQSDVYIPATIKEASKAFMFFAFDIPNPNRVIGSSKEFGLWPMEKRKAHNALYAKHQVCCRDIPRDDKDLIAVVEKLGDKANGCCAKLGLVNIPDGVEFTIEEYDGLEHVAEKHRAWN